MPLTQVRTRALTSDRIHTPYPYRVLDVPRAYTCWPTLRALQKPKPKPRRCNRPWMSIQCNTAIAWTSLAQERTESLADAAAQRTSSQCESREGNTARCSLAGVSSRAQVHPPSPSIHSTTRSWLLRALLAATLAPSLDRLFCT